MTFRKRALFIAILGIGASAGYFGYHTHIDNVRAAKLEHLVAPKPFFPAGSLWTQDVSHAPEAPVMAFLAVQPLASGTIGFVMPFAVE